MDLGFLPPLGPSSRPTVLLTKSTGRIIRYAAVTLPGTHWTVPAVASLEQQIKMPAP